MPVFLRKFYINETEKAFIEKAKAIEEASKGSSSSTNSVLKPAISPK